MTNDELRALADALADEDFELRDSPMRVRRKWADYLRACADARPVAWMHIDGRVISAATMDQAYKDGGAMQSSLREYTIPLYTHPAPAAPQAEPIDPHMIVADDRFPDEQAEQKLRSIRQAVARGWCHQKNSGKEMDVDLAVTIADEVMAINQAEPKREPSLGELMREQRQSRIVAGAYPDGNPNAGAMMAQTRQAEPKRGLTCLWSRAADDTDMWETSCGHAFTIIDGTPSDNHMEFCCYCGRRVDEEIGGSDE